MFKFRRQKNELELKKEELEKLKQDLMKEINELSFIKNELNKTQPVIDITNVYIWYDDEIGIYNIVRYDVRPIVAKNIFDKLANGYESTLVDIFSNNILYHKLSMTRINYKESVLDDKSYKTHNAYLIPISKVDKNVLAFVDNKVPLYVLQQLYYKLNKVDVKAYILKK